MKPFQQRKISRIRLGAQLLAFGLLFCGGFAVQGIRGGVRFTWMGRRVAGS